MVRYVVSLQIAAVVSVMCSGSVVLTVLMFESMRRKLFMQIIAFISISDLIANSPYLSTYRPPNGNWQCSMSGFINLYFYPVSWIWTTTLMFFLYSLATKGKLPLSALIIHSFCWIFPLILTLLNLTTNTFGMGQAHPYEVCVISADKNQFAAEMWHIITYYGFWLVCVALMVLMYIRIVSMNQKDLSSKFPLWQSSIAPLQLYPLAMFVCWMPHMIAVFCEYFSWFHGLNEFYFASDIIKITHGALTALIFFTNSTEARGRWRKALRKRCADLKSLKMKLLQQNEVKDVDNEVISQDFSVEYEEDNFSISRTIHTASPAPPEGSFVGTVSSSIQIPDAPGSPSSSLNKQWMSSSGGHSSNFAHNAIHFPPHDIDSRNTSVDIY